MDCQLNQKQELQACLNNVPQNEASMIFRGQNGNGIVDIQKTSSVGLVDTYTIYYTDGNTDTFTVTNGKDGAGDVQSVNGQIGDVFLTASDVGALPDSTVIPDPQIQSNWTQTDNTKVDYIKNKPTIPVDADLVHKAGAETISGTKTFTGNPEFKATAYNQCLTVNRDGTLGAFVAFKNSNGAIGAIGMHANQIPQCANYNNTDTRALVRAGYYTTSNPDAHVGDTSTPIYIDANGIAQPCSLNGNSRNVGEIVTSTIPLTDAGLHLLDGALLQYGSYKAFIDYMAELYGDGTNIPDYFCSESDWQTSVTNYGSCDKYVYDSTNNTVRLPKRTSEHGLLIKSYSSGTDWYRIYEDGWCEQGGTYSTGSGNKSVTFLKSFIDTNYFMGFYINYNSPEDGEYPFLGSKSIDTITFRTSYAYGGGWLACGYIDISDYQYSPIYEYIVIANSTKTEIEVDIDEVMTDLNGKADTDLSNLSQTGLSKLNYFATNTYVNIAVQASGYKYTIDHDGWITVASGTGAVYLTVRDANDEILLGNSANFVSGAGSLASVLVKSGQTVQVIYTNTLVFIRLTYI